MYHNSLYIKRLQMDETSWTSVPCISLMSRSHKRRRRPWSPASSLIPHTRHAWILHRTLYYIVPLYYILPYLFDTEYSLKCRIIYYANYYDKGGEVKWSAWGKKIVKKMKKGKDKRRKITLKKGKKALKMHLFRLKTKKNSLRPP